jgi:pimeloyl-ACP methyl ester carboxylesterase
MRLKVSVIPGVVLGSLSFLGAHFAAGEDSQQLLTIDHYIRVRSSVPVIAGEHAHIYVRERAKAGTILRRTSFAGRVVLFVHGAGLGSASFDLPYKDYSWMTYLANAGFDVFAMDFTGYGRSTRPAVLDDPCNLPAESQLTLVPFVLSATCSPSYPSQVTTIASEWDDLHAVVDYLRALRHVDRVSLVGWSLGGPRAGGFTARHPEKVDKMVLFAPVFDRTSSSSPPAKVPAPGPAMTKTSVEDMRANWDRQIQCPDQYEPAIRDVLWSESLSSDPVGATWGPGVRRNVATTVWGWNADTAAKVQVPTLLVSAVHDVQVPAQDVKDLYASLGANQKALIDLGCASHLAVWEKNHTLLFQASLEWLASGSVKGTRDGMIRLGY